MDKNQPFFKISIFEMKTDFRLEILQTVANWKLSKMQLGRLFFSTWSRVDYYFIQIWISQLHCEGKQEDKGIQHMGICDRLIEP